MSQQARFVPLSVGPSRDDTPNGWRWFRLTDLARLESGHTPSRNHPEWWGGDIPWIALPDIRALDGKRVFDTLQHTNAAGIENSSARVLPTGTVVLSRTASVGFVTIMGRPMATSQDFVNWVSGPDLDPDFLALLFRTARDFIRSVSSGAIHQTVYFSTVEQFYVCMPPVDEQRRIAGHLSSTLERVNRARVAAYEQLRLAATLASRHLSAVFTSADSARWPLRLLVDICERSGQYGTSSKPNVDGNGISVLRMSNLGWGEIDWGDLKYVDLPPTEADAYRLQPGDIVFNRTNSAELVGKTAVFEGGREAVFASYLIRFRVRPDLADPWFVSAYINSPPGRTFIAQNMARAIGQVNISASTMHRMRIPLPSLEQQRRIAAKLAEASHTTKALRYGLEEQLSALDAVPAALLRRAFEGGL